VEKLPNFHFWWEKLPNLHFWWEKHEKNRQGWKLEKQDRFSMSEAYGIENGSTLACFKRPLFVWFFLKQN
jgi:hypothetical protein